MRRRERGMSESVQWAVLTPLVLTLILGIIQVGLWAYGRQVASNAAVAAAEEASLLGSTSVADGRGMGRLIAEKGGMVGVQVEVTEHDGQMTATVEGSMANFVDVGLTRVSEQCTRPKEQVSTP